MIHLHRWTKWRATHHYTDASFGGRATSTRLTRRCERCGLVGSKGMYGVVLDLEEPS